MPIRVVLLAWREMVIGRFPCKFLPIMHSFRRLLFRRVHVFHVVQRMAVLPLRPIMHSYRRLLLRHIHVLHVVHRMAVLPLFSIMKTVLLELLVRLHAMHVLTRMCILELGTILVKLVPCLVWYEASHVLARMRVPERARERTYERLEARSRA